MEAESLYTASTVLCADSIESVPGRSGLFTLATYQVDKEEQEAAYSGQAEASTATSSSPAYSRRGTCTLHRAVLSREQDAAASKVQCDALQVIDTPAILDMKWSIARGSSDGKARRILGTANAKGQVSIHQLDETDHTTQQPKLTHLKTLRLNDRKALCLSLDWSDRRGGIEHGYNFGNPSLDTSLIVSQSDGSLAYLPSLEAASVAEATSGTPQSHDASVESLSIDITKIGLRDEIKHANDEDNDEDDWDRTSEDERHATLLASHMRLNEPFADQPRGLETWQAHDYEAWIAAFDCWSGGRTIWSGGDDLALKGWDLRTPNSDIGRQPTFKATKGFDGGVTTLQSHHLRQHLWAVGSYDGRLRLFDARNPLRPFSETEVGGGIWRAKWHPTDPTTLLVACMHDGFKILRLDHLSGNGNELNELKGQEAEIVTRFNGHKSLAYGCDWDRGADVPGQNAEQERRLVYSCSFYDAATHIWRSS